eukprot:5500605-Pyramimonas_sp.AAC.1
MRLLRPRSLTTWCGHPIICLRHNRLKLGFPSVSLSLSPSVRPPPSASEGRLPITANDGQLTNKRIDNRFRAEPPSTSPPYPKREPIV